MRLLDILKKKHQHKVKEKERFEFLRSFRSSSPPQWENPFVTLRHLADHKKNTTPENDIFRELHQTTEKMKRSQKTITFNNLKNLKKWDEKTIIQKLREMSKIK